MIQSNDGFSLQNILEVRFFLNQLILGDDVFVISDDIWANAKRELRNKFQKSSRMEICDNIINDFEATNPKKKYKSDLDVFIRESKLEDFFSEKNGETIFVSTIHKAKGKEFDNVFIMLEDFNIATDISKRQLYVAITRAKDNLTIHLNGNYLDRLTTEKLERVNDMDKHLPPSQLAMHLKHEDINLGYFEFIQHRLTTMMSGNLLTGTAEGYTNSNGDLVLKFSKKFIEVLKVQANKGYELKEAKVNFVLYWKKPNEDKEIKIVLPELLFER